MKDSIAAHSALTLTLLLITACPTDDELGAAVDDESSSSDTTATTTTAPTTSTSTDGTTTATTTDPDSSTGMRTTSSTDGTTSSGEETASSSDSGSSSESSSSTGDSSSSTGSPSTTTTDPGTSTTTTAVTTEGGVTTSSSTGTTVSPPECGDGDVEGDEECDDMDTDNTDGCLETCRLARTCAQILDEVPGEADGPYEIDPDDTGSFLALCDMTTDGGGWTLAARFAAADNVDNWMQDDGSWWFDLEVEQGNTLSRTQLVDMMSASFWRVPGDEFKIGRSDNLDPSHLLLTQGNCLGGDTFRGFITSLGYNGIGTWADDEVLAQCTIDLANNFDTTDGFAQVAPPACSPGNIGSPTTISFWASWHVTDNPFAADAAVMMIGAGGDDCSRADHGIGITEENSAQFAVGGEVEGVFEADFGNDGFSATSTAYALNLWVR